MSNIEIEVPTGGSVKLSDLNLPQANSTWAAETLKLAGEAPTETKKKSEAKEELEAPSAEELAAGKAAQKALIDINKTGKAQAKRSWDDWMLVGAGVAACMEYAKRCGDGHTTNPKYKAAKAAFEEQFNLVSLHKSTASRLRKCYENRKAVEAWREEQEKVGNYQNLNHPVAVWSAYHSGKKSSEVRDAKWVANFLDDIFSVSPAKTATEIGKKYCRIGKEQVDYPKMLAVADILADKVKAEEARVGEENIHYGIEYLRDIALALALVVDKAATDKKAESKQPKK